MKSLLEQKWGKSKIYIITIIKVSFIGMVLALLVSTLELNAIELTLYLVAAYFLGYEIGKRSIKSVPFDQDKTAITELVPVSHPTQDKQLEQNVVILENPSMSSNKETEVLPQIVLNPLQKHSSSQQIERDRFSNQLLKQKVELQHKKIQSTSYFQTRLESSKNTRFMRKIEKHEIVTDYELEVQNTSSMMVPFKDNPISALSEPQSIFEVVAHQDYNMKLPSPLIQQKFISLGQLNSQWKQQMVPTWILENGRFSKTYSQTKLIGQGGFGRVYEAFNLLQEKSYAIKKLVMKGMVKVHELMNEVFIISKFSHPHIVSYFSCWIELATIDDAELVSCSIPMANFLEGQKQAKEEKEMLYVESNSGFTFEKSSKRSRTKSIRRSQNGKSNSMVPFEALCENSINLIQICTLHIQMQLCETSLHSFMKHRTEVDAAYAFCIFEQIVSGIQFLHSNGIVHRDLKPANILLCKQKGKIKIGDFGLAALVQEHGELIIRQKIGTPLYMAPEMQDGNRIQRKKIDLIDVYAIGVIYYELLHLLNQATQHERSEKLMFLQCNKVVFANKDLKQQRKMIKLLTKTINRPNIRQVMSSKQMQELKRKYRANAQ